MARLVKKTATLPYILGEHHICMCGLSNNQPFCDSSHKRTSTEKDGKLYWHDGDTMEEVTTEPEEGCCGGDNCCGNCPKEVPGDDSNESKKK